jgi:hypothetical protein
MIWKGAKWFSYWNQKEEKKKKLSCLEAQILFGSACCPETCWILTLKLIDVPLHRRNATENACKSYTHSMFPTWSNIYKIRVACTV